MEELDPKNFTHKNATKAFRLWNVTHTKEGGYTHDDYTIHLWEDGGFTISENDGEGFISLHGDIALNFRKLINKS